MGKFLAIIANLLLLTCKGENLDQLAYSHFIVDVIVQHLNTLQKNLKASTIIRSLLTVFFPKNVQFS